MAHCPIEMLDDLADLLAEVRTWDDVVEKSPGVFYARRTPFLHFHWSKDGTRRADVKGKGDWVEVELPRPAPAAARRRLRRALAAQYEAKWSR